MRWYVAVAAALLLAMTPAGGSDLPNLQRYEESSWSRITASNNDQPTIVHVWGLTCPSCLAELPHWGALAAAHPEARLVLINWDKHAYNPARVAEALRKSRLEAVEHWVFLEGYEEKLRFAIDPQWQGEMPYTQLRAPGGATRAFTGKADFAMLAAWISEHTPAPVR